MSVKEITKTNFKKYGKIIEYPNVAQKGDKRNLWHIIHKVEAKVGWRIAYLVLRDKTIGRLERHVDSDETLEPVKGKSLLFVSTTSDLSEVECFALDKPVLLYENTWHGLISLSASAELKVVENVKVKSEFWNFGFRINKNNWEKKCMKKYI